MTTTFHFEADEPRYESSFENADVQLRCQGMVAVAAGPAYPSEDGAGTWYELSPISGNQILAGVGRSGPNENFESVIATRERIWASAMAGLTPLEMVETTASPADCVYAQVDPTNGYVDLGRSGHGASALIIDSNGIRTVSFAPSGSGLGQSSSLALSAGSTLLLLTHEPSRREEITAALGREVAARSVQGDQEPALLGCCIQLRNGPLDESDSIVAVHLERLSGSPVRRRHFNPSPRAGEVLRENAFVSTDIFEIHAAKKFAPAERQLRCRTTSAKNRKAAALSPHSDSNRAFAHGASEPSISRCA
jgi:hypothetical protein